MRKRAPRCRILSPSQWWRILCAACRRTTPHVSRRGFCLLFLIYNHVTISDGWGCALVVPCICMIFTM